MRSLTINLSPPELQRLLGNTFPPSSADERNFVLRASCEDLKLVT